MNNDLERALDQIFEPPKKTQYTVKQGVFALLCWPLAGIMVEGALFHSLGFLTALSVLLFVIVTVTYRLISAKRISLAGILCAAVLLICAWVLFYSDYDLLKWFVVLFSCVFGLYFVYVTFEAGDATRPDYMLPFDLLRAVFVLPFSHMKDDIPAIAGLLRGKKGSNTARNILLGLALAIIPALLVLTQLLADTAFSAFIDGLFADLHFDPVRLFVHAVIGIPLALFLFGALYGCAEDKKPETLSRSKCLQSLFSAKCIPAISIYVALLPLFLLYFLYFFAQLPYYTSAFSGSLPDGYSFSEYARSGFFELCKVAVINLAVLALSSLLTKGKGQERKKPKALTAMQVALCFFTMALIAIAQSKICLYVKEFGLTRLRYGTLAFTILLWLVLILVTVKMFVPRFNLAAVLFVLCVCFFCLFAAIDCDRVIVRYNIEAYESGRLTSFDADVLYELSPSVAFDVGKFGWRLMNTEGADAALLERLDLYLRDTLDALNLSNRAQISFDMNLSAYRTRQLLSGEFFE